MNCKDSEVFALEKSIEMVLNNCGWKEPREIKKELTNGKNSDYINMIKKHQGGGLYEVSEELIVTQVMDRLCCLFPMKYKKKGTTSGSRKYKRNIGRFGK